MVRQEDGVSEVVHRTPTVADSVAGRVVGCVGGQAGGRCL